MNLSSTCSSINETNLFIIHVKVSSIRFKSLERIIDFYIINTISILKTSEFVVREVRNESVYCVVLVCNTVWIRIKHGELPEVATTSYSEQSRSFNIVVLWVWNILRTNLGLSQVKTNNRRATRNNNTPMNTVHLIESIIWVCQIIDGFQIPSWEIISRGSITLSIIV